MTIIEGSDLLGRDMEANTMAVLKAEIKAGNVKVLTSTRVSEINDAGVVVIDAKGDKTVHETETVIVALDLAPTASTLATELADKVNELYVIGDAKVFLRIKNAIDEGFVTASNL